MSALPRPKGILFDRGGVLVQRRDDGDARTVSERFGDWMATHYRLDPARWLEALVEPSVDYDTGRLCPLERLEVAAANYGWPLKHHEMARIVNAESTCLFQVSHLDPEIYVLDRIEQRGLKLGLCSNASPLEEGCDRLLGLAGRIKFRGYSHLMGVKKPDPRAYEIAAARIGLKPHELWFVDDGGDGSLQGAEAVGLTAIYYEHPEAVGVRHPELVADFTGPRIHRLGELEQLLAAAGCP